MAATSQIRQGELEGVASRVKTCAAVIEADIAWARAPATVRIMAGAYVAPILNAIVAINQELQELKNGR